MSISWNERDLKQFKLRGKSAKEVTRQVEFLQRGFRGLELVRPCVVGDGIFSLSEQEKQLALESFLKIAREESVSFFVPASGAASRMFKPLYSFLADEKESDFSEFIHNLSKTPFYEKLKAYLGKAPEELIDGGKTREVVEAILNEEGLGYGQAPKGMILFHR